VLEALPILIALLATLAVCAPLAPRLRIPQPVLLGLAGFALAFVPGLPRKPLDPDLILVAFLPPILYADAFKTSWVDFQRWLRPILMLSVGLVALTILCVGMLTYWLLPELPLSVCFILGAIVSPTDTVAVQSVLETLRVPRRITAILGGESLVNDATGLVGVQIGVAVVLTGAFDGGAIAGKFAWVAGGGIATGLAIGALGVALNRIARATPVLFALSLAAPYLAFWIASECGASGVLAVVVAGFLVSWRIHHLPADARIALYGAWDLLVWILNGLCFVFIGLETPRLVRDLSLDRHGEVVWAGLGIALAVMLLRALWMFPGAYLPLWLSPRLREREGGYPAVRNVVVASWCGVRGAVSLAAALALPLHLPNGAPFPGRQQVQACALCVILVTLVVQGSTLGWLVRWLGIRGDEATASEVRAAREALLQAGIRRLDQFCSETSCPLSVHHWRTLMSDELVTLRDKDDEQRRQARSRLSVSDEVRAEVAAAQAARLLALRDGGSINDRTYLDLQLALDRESRPGRDPTATE
jgi:CPA1 family monovalent cation:H+ antiporter